MGSPRSGATPGLKVVRRSKSLDAVWVAREDLRKAGFLPRTVKLSPDPWPAMTAADKDQLYGDRCRHLWREMLDWASDPERSKVPPYDGSLTSLSRIYQSHPDSPFHECSTGTRRNYVNYCKAIEASVGTRRADKLTTSDFRRWHTNFMSPDGHEGPPHLRQAQALMNMLRGLLRFGSGLRYPGLRETYAILSDIEFKTPKRKRVEYLSYEQAKTVIEAALALDTRRGRSIALGQALQFELTLRQTDVIGTWESIDKPQQLPPGAVPLRGKVWFPGMLWEMIEAPTVEKDPKTDKEVTRQMFRGDTLKNGHDFDFDLMLYPLLQKAMAAVPETDRHGAMIVNDDGLPFANLKYGYHWRQIATKAGIPMAVKNRDSRAGGVTEATDAGADLEKVRHHAQHSSVQTTARYSRNREKKTADVARIRVAARAANKA